LSLSFVVVAADSGWLITPLELHHQGPLGPGDSGVTFANWELTPANYHETIFQIPLVLRPMSKEGYERSPSRHRTQGGSLGKSGTQPSSIHAMRGCMVDSA
jgi:hypothetical protein